MDPQENPSKPVKSRGPGKATPAKQRAFLEAYRTTVNVRQSLKAAKIEYNHFHRWYKSNTKFREEWDQIQDAAAQTLEDEAVRRAVQGCKRAIYYRGKRVYAGTGKDRKPVYELEFSDQLLIHLLRRFRPALYRDNWHVEHSGSLNLVERLTQARERLIALNKQRDDAPTGTAG